MKGNFASGSEISISQRNFQRFVCEREIWNENLVWRLKFRLPFVVIARGSQNAECKLWEKNKKTKKGFTDGSPC